MQSIFISRKARLAATTDWKTLGIFFKATRRLVRGSVTALKKKKENIDWTLKNSFFFLRNRLTKWHRMHHNQLKNLNKTKNVTNELNLIKFSSNLRVHFHLSTKQLQLKMWTRMYLKMSKMVCLSSRSNMDDALMFVDWTMMVQFVVLLLYHHSISLYYETSQSKQNSINHRQ